jgi:triacylglycerol lipase
MVGPPPDIAEALRHLGRVIDPPATARLYASVPRPEAGEAVDCLRDLPYGEDERHRLDVYRPRGLAPGQAPVLVFVHGGGFMRGDKAEREHIGLALARRGRVVVLPNHRLAPRHGWPAGAEDVAAVFRWVQRHAATHGGDAGRIWLAGESAGATHVAWALLASRFLGGNRQGLAGGFLVSGTYHPWLEHQAAQALGMAADDPRNRAHFGADPGLWRERSLVRRIDVAPFPLWLSYAALDPPQFQVATGELMARLVADHGFSPYLRIIEGHNHLSQIHSVGTGDHSLSDLLEAATAEG